MRRSLLAVLLASLPAVTLFYQTLPAATAEPVQAFSAPTIEQLTQIELPKEVQGSQANLTSLDSLASPFISIAHGYYRLNQLEKFRIALAKLDRSAQARLLSSIARTSNWQDNVQAAENLIAQFFPQNNRSFLLDDTYYWIVQRLLDQNRIDEAASLMTTKMAHADTYRSSDAYEKIVSDYLRQNRLPEASEMIKQFNALQNRWLAVKQIVRRDDSWLDKNYQSLISYYLTRQQYRNAFEISQRLQGSNILKGYNDLKPSTNQIRVLLNVAATCSNSCSKEGRQVRNQALKRAESLASQFEDVEYRVEYLAAAAMGFSKAGQKAKADQVFAQALQLVPKITSRYTANVAEMQAQAIAEVASYQAGAGDLPQSLKLTNQLPKGDKNRQALLLGIANLYAKQGNQKRSAELYGQAIREEGKKHIGAVVKSYLAVNKDQQAIQLVREIQDPDDKQWELMQLSKFYQDRRNRIQALAFLNEAVALFPEKLDRDPYYQKSLFQVMLKTVETYRELKDLNGAERLLDRVLSLANQASETPVGQYSDTDLKSAALYRVATAYAQIGKITKSLEIVPTIHDLKVQDLARLEIVNGYLDAKTPDKALELVRSIQQPKIQATALTNTAHYFINNQQPKQAVPLLDEAFNLMKLIP